MQGRFWEEQLASLNIPAASRSKFAFEDGNPRVCTSPFPVLLTKATLLYAYVFVLTMALAVNCLHSLLVALTKQPTAGNAVLLELEPCIHWAKLIQIKPLKTPSIIHRIICTQ